MTRGAARLSNWLANQSRSDIALVVGVDVSLIGHWARGRRRPSLDLAFALERITGGAVTARDWTLK